MEPVLTDYKVELKIRIDWSEMDLFGHVNNVMFMKYLQAARVNFWELEGLNNFHKKYNIGPILAATGCQFKKPLFYPGNVVVKSKIEFIKNSSFGIQHVLLNDGGEVVALGNDVVVTYDFNKNEKIEMPDWLKERMQKYV